MQNGNLQKLTETLGRPARLVFHEEDDGWWVESPDLPGFYTSGDSFREIQNNIHDALLTYFDIPDDEGIKDRILISKELTSQLQVV